MSYFPEPHTSSKIKIAVELDLSNLSDLRNLSDLVKNDVVKRTEYGELFKNVIAI